MAAVFYEVNLGKPVTSGLRKVTGDMKTKNRANRTGVISAGGKEGRVSSPSFSKVGPQRLELHMGRKWVVENHIGKKILSLMIAMQSNLFIFLVAKIQFCRSKGKSTT